jgi:hypothetical protein
MSVQAATGSFSATGNGNPFVPNTGRVNNNCQFNVSVYGTFVGTVVLERSFDSGANYIPVYRYCTGTAVSYTAPASEVLPEPEGDVIYRLRCSAYTSGTANYRLSD